MMETTHFLHDGENDRLGNAIAHPDQDRYGFVHVARHMRLAIDRLGRKGSAVIGIEGAWGSGKTSLLNLLETELRNRREDRTFVLNISPWLNGDNVSPVGSLLLPVADIVDKEEMKQASWWRRRWLWLRTRKKTAFLILQYLQTTSKYLAPIADMAAIIPGVPNSGTLFRALGKITLEDKNRTAATLRTDIAIRLEKLDLSFIVLIDDLDRLEPAQAVEVVRLVKSVADFPRFRYVLCYDREVLASAITAGIQINDGVRYLQKILQLTFSLPKPESFQLRREFAAGASELFKNANGDELDAGMQEAIDELTDHYGKMLNTPREVRLALDAMVFLYPDVRDYVYFPDLCLLQLLRVTNAPLYNWIEQYLTERAVVVSGDGTVSDDEKRGLTELLSDSLQIYGNNKLAVILTFSKWVPGIGQSNESELEIFVKESEELEAKATAFRRLASSSYWRYYFAFSAPQNILPPEYFTDLFALAGDRDSDNKLAVELLGKINSNGITSRTWFEHILSQLTERLIRSRSYEECEGLLRFFFDYNDGIRALYHDRVTWFSWQSLGIEEVVHELLRRLLSLKRSHALALLNELLTRGGAWFWGSLYMRNLLVKHGMVGSLTTTEEDILLTNNELKQLREGVVLRMREPGITSQLFLFDNLYSYMNAWTVIDSSEHVSKWVQGICLTDDGFFNLLSRLKSTVHTSHRGTYLEIQMNFFARLAALSVEDIRARLNKLGKKTEWAATVNEIRNDLDDL